METHTYNGWTNYATWRVNLEIFDATQWVKEDFVPDEQKLTVYDLSSMLEDRAEHIVSGYGELDTNEAAGLALSYAFAFLEDVNWYEIAEHFVENYPDWNITKD